MAKASQERGSGKPLGLCVMPRDVATRWNSTYEMLDFAYKYRRAFNEITGNRNMNMRTYELSNEDWKIVKGLAEVLKVRTLIYFKIFQRLKYFRSSRMRHYFFHVPHLILRR